MSTTQQKEPIIARMLRVIWANRLLVLLVAALIGFIYILEEILSGDILELDSAAYRFFVVFARRPWLTTIMEGFSALASPVVLAVMLLVIAAFAPGHMPGRCATANLVLAVGLNFVLKSIVQRPRPDGFRLVAESGYSFPSGHSMVSMAFYGLVVWMVWRYEKDRILRIFLMLAFSLVIAMVGISRIYLGVHYASDVIAGFCVSLVWLMFFTRVFVPIFMQDEPPENQQSR